MASNKIVRKDLQHFWQGVRDVAGTWGLAIVILGISFVVAYQFVGPAPPKTIVMLTGEDDGAYQHYGEQFAKYLAAEGIQLELRTTAGSVENLALLDSDADVDIGFVQGGLSEYSPTENVMAIGSLYLEPLWLFLRSDVEIDEMADLADMRIAVGAEGSGTRPVVLSLLHAHGIDSQTTELLDVAPDELVHAFSANDIDAALIIGGPESDQIVDLIDLQDVRLHNLERADAYVRRFSYVSKVNLPQGVLDLQANRPETDISTVALTAMLAASNDLHPALVDLLLVAAADIHGKHSLLADAGQFPTPLYVDLPLNENAARHFERGPPFLMRYLPFWAATLVDRLWVMLLPLIGLAIPLAKLVPPAYHWQIRRRVLRLYAELERIDPLLNPVQDDKDLTTRLQRLDTLDNSSVLESVPKAYKVDIFKLRRDIDLIRRRLGDGVRPKPDIRAEQV
jgi:TRAP transporter TAXI family solute receptor